MEHLVHTLLSPPPKLFVMFSFQEQEPREVLYSTGSIVTPDCTFTLKMHKHLLILACKLDCISRIDDFFCIISSPYAHLKCVRINF